MSIRIHELAKKIGMDNKELLTLLKERKFDVKSVSSTIDNISAEALVEELKAKSAPVPPPADAPAATAEEPKAEVAKVKAPHGIFVKSVQDVAREKAEKVEKEHKERAALSPVATAKPAPSAPLSPASRPISAPPIAAKAPPPVSVPLAPPMAKSPLPPPPIP